MAPRSAPAIIPVFTNVFSPPVMPYRRAYAFSAALRNARQALDADLRRRLHGLTRGIPLAAVLERLQPEADAFLARMKAFQTHGKSVLEKDPYTCCATWRPMKSRWPSATGGPLNSPHPWSTGLGSPDARCPGSRRRRVPVRLSNTRT